MNTKNIPYCFCTDYSKLYDLVREGYTMIGYLNSQLVEINQTIHNEQTPYFLFNFGNISLLEEDISKEQFIGYCSRNNVRYFDVDRNWLPTSIKA